MEPTAADPYIVVDGEGQVIVGEDGIPNFTADQARQIAEDELGTYPDTPVYVFKAFHKYTTEHSVKEEVI